MLTRLYQPIKKDVPHEPGEFFELRKVPHTVLKRSRKLAAKEGHETARDLGPEIVKAFASDDEDQKKGARKLIEERRYEPDQFDTTELLLAGVASWSYDAKVSKLSIDDLDEETAEWAKREVIALTKPPTKEEEKKAPGNSTTPSMEMVPPLKSG